MKNIEIYYTNGNVLSFNVYDVQIDDNRLYLASPAPVGIAQILSLSIEYMTRILVDGIKIYIRREV